MAKAPEIQETVVEYNASPTLARFHASPAFVRGVMGPVGSGKSVGMCFEAHRLMQTQAPKNGVRKTKGVVIRNTLPELETTTMKTWTDWFKPGTGKGQFGHLTGRPPYVHHVRYDLPDGTRVECDVLFLALDKPEDVKKLLSLEVSWGWINEAREVPKEVLDALTARVGRYPSAKDGGCTRPCVFMDTNPPPENHWWFNLAELDTPPDFEFFKQPGGMDPDAENLENLLQTEDSLKLPLRERREHGRKHYYEKIMQGKDPSWIQVMVHGQYGYIKKGQPVYAGTWNESVHVAKEPIKVNPKGELILGIDCSGRHPATIFLQVTARGQVQAVDELVTFEDEGMGARAYARRLQQYIATKYPHNVIEQIWGDPAGGFKSQNDEETYFEILHSCGINVQPSPEMRWPPRRETVEYYLTNMIDGQPLFIVSPVCKTLIQGFNGGYQFPKIHSGGETRIADDRNPVKNRFSDPQNGLEYGLCGIGGYRKLLGRNWGAQETVILDTGWSPFH